MNWNEMSKAKAKAMEPELGHLKDTLFGLFWSTTPGPQIINLVVPRLPT